MMIGCEVVDAVRQSAVVWCWTPTRLRVASSLPHQRLLSTSVLQTEYAIAQHAERWLLTRTLQQRLKMVVVDPDIVVRTERLLLRPLAIEDAADVLLMRKHPEVMKHT